jgi:hypothetical protein
MDFNINDSYPGISSRFYFKKKKKYEQNYYYSIKKKFLLFDIFN